MKHPITVRIDVGLLQAARHRAQAENRTLTNFLETVLKQHIARTAAVADAGRTETERHGATSAAARSGTQRAVNRKPAHG